MLSENKDIVGDRLNQLFGPSESHPNNDFLDQQLNKIKTLPGINSLYLLGSDFEIHKEWINTPDSIYLEQVKNIIKSKCFEEFEGALNNPKPFHTFTFLNETGLIIITKLDFIGFPYLIVIAGENEPVDLINLLKICKETRLSLE